MSLHHQRCSDKLSLPLLMDFILPKIVFLKDYYYMYIQRRVILFLNSVPPLQFYALILLNTLLLSLPQEAHFIVAILLWYEKNCWSLFHYSRRLLNDILWLWHFFGQIKKFNNIKWLKIEAGSDLESRLWMVPKLQLKVNCRIKELV